MDKNRLNKLLNFEQVNVLVLGDVMVDEYINGSCDRISPEAPVPIVHLKDKKHKPGGAANVAMNLASLGANVHLVSVTGKDEYSEILKDKLKHKNLYSHFILEKGRRTTVKSRIISSNQQLLRIDHEDLHPISMESIHLIMQRVISLHSNLNFDLVLFQDYNKGYFNEASIKEMFNWAKGQEIWTALDPKIENISLFSGIDLFKPNLKELSHFLNIELSANKVSLDHAIELLKEKFAFNSIIVTLSSSGIYIQNFEGSYHSLSKKRSIIDVSGAGDSVFAVASLLVLQKFASIEEIAEISNLAGAAACGISGVAVLTKEDIIKEYLRP